MMAHFSMTMILGHQACRVELECEADAILSADGAMAVESGMIQATDQLRRLLAIQYVEGKGCAYDYHHS